MSDTDRPQNNRGPSGEGAELRGDAEPREDAEPRGGAEPRGDGEPPVVVSEREAYFQALRLWFQLVHMQQNISTCFFMMGSPALQNSPSNVPLLNNNYQFQGQQFQFPVPQPERNVAGPNVPNEQLGAAEVIARHGGYEYVIPPLYKRLLAEMIDFVFLFILKLLVTFVAVDMFELIDLEKFDFYKLTQHYDDYKYAMELTSEIFFLEVIYRILVCLFEGICLCGSVGRTGGATPGKALLGLRVVTASALIAVDGRPRETVLLYPGRPLTFGLALARSIMKNFLISLLFPLCVVLFVFRHNRTGYDLLCGVLVVEENMYPPRRHAA